MLLYYTQHGLSPSPLSNAGEALLALCYEADLPPCVVLRRVLEHLPLGLQGSRATTELLRSPASLPQMADADAVRRLVAAEEPGRAGRSNGDSSSCSGAALSLSPPKAGDTVSVLLGDSETEARAGELLRRLQADIEECVDCDHTYGPLSDASRRAAGLAHEAQLYSLLDAADIAYWKEEELRAKGFTKTPDAKLIVPVSVRGRIVNWIDSKATFADARLHRHHLEEQYRRYCNRFGPGMVIYWHGYVALVGSETGGEGEGVLVADGFPEKDELMVLPRLQVEVIEMRETVQGGGGERVMAGMKEPG
jgi:CDAN1-interacting nuclease 1